MRSAKGSDFEREICKRLSKWWTAGERDDVFWRSSQSGGRATRRSKKGLTTFGSYGDIAAVDPIGAPLIKMFTIELKRGSSYSSPGDLLDFKKDNSSHPWIKCLEQAIKSHEQAGSKSWMMLCRRDHRRTIIFLPATVFALLEAIEYDDRVKFFLTLPDGKRVVFVGIDFDWFLREIEPEQIIGLLSE